MTDIYRETPQDKTKTTVNVPTPVEGTPKASGDMNDLIALMARLRADCPWDKKQTNQSLIPYAIEEAYELAEAVHDNDNEDIKGELGDVLLQVIFHCQLYAEQNRFGFGDVIQTLQEKLIRRHPHVFDKDNLPDDAAVKERWDEIKAEENAAKAARGKPKRRLDNIKAGSALMQAQELQKQASKLGFDWDGLSGALDKLDEEIGELKTEIENKSKSEIKANKAIIEKELGDCFFALVNIARKLDLDAEAATLTCVHKFKSRFGFIEDELLKLNQSLEDSTLFEMEQLWQAAKRYEND